MAAAQSGAPAQSKIKERVEQRPMCVPLFYVGGGFESSHVTFPTPRDKRREKRMKRGQGGERVDAIVMETC